MTLRVSVRVKGLLQPSELARMRIEQRESHRQAVAGGMNEWGRVIARKVGEAARNVLRLRGNNIPRSMKHKVFASKPTRLPAVMIFSRVPWLGAHTEGATIYGKGGGLLIPLLQKRIGRVAFKRVVDHILRNGLGFFKQVGGNVILFAEYQSAQGLGRPLARFRREYRSATGVKRIKAGTDVPIAVLVKSVRIQKRLHFDAIVKSGLDDLAAAIEKRMTF